MTRRPSALFCLAITALALAAGPPLASAQSPQVTVGSKKFTESVILGEIAAHLAQTAGADVRHRRELGGSQVLFKALQSGELDIYPEYTGTLEQELLAGSGAETLPQIRAQLADLGIRMTEPLGFNNTYIIGMKEAQAEKLGIETISDLRDHPDLRFGFSNEFMERGDGWPSLRERYSLPHRNVYGMDHDLAYRGLAAGSIDVVDLYATDAEIEYYDLRAIEDDLGHFPEYLAAFLYRADLEQRAPEVVDALARLGGAIPERAMVRMNAAAKLERIPESRVAAEFLQDRLDLETESRERGRLRALWQRTLEHLFLVGVSLGAAIVLSIPLGFIAFRLPRAGQFILGGVGVIQTIPSLALLVFMIPLLGIGAAPAIAALFLYSLLPIVRNTHAGLTSIPGPVRESAEALGLSDGARLRLVELPMAAGTILAGIKTSAVINIGTATLGALIGAGGYGQPILTGIRLDNLGLILQGAVPAAALAFVVQGLFELAERWLVSPGLRLKS